MVLVPRMVLVPSALESVFMAASIFSLASPCSPVAALSLAVVSQITVAGIIGHPASTEE